MAKYNICLDVGGTKVLGVIFNEKREIIYRLKKKSKGKGDSSANVEEVIVSVVEEMLEGAGIRLSEVNAIASCAPGVIDQDAGIVLFTPNLPWRNYDIRSSMEKRFGVPFYVFCPSTTVDLKCETGGDIVIENRPGEEIGSLYFEKPVTPRGVGFYNPSFDVTPSELISAIVTEKGVFRYPYDMERILDK